MTGISTEPIEEGIGVTSKYGDMRVVVFLPLNFRQEAWSFHPSAASHGMLELIRTLLADALQDVDDERQRRARTAYEVAMVPPALRPATW